MRLKIGKAGRFLHLNRGTAFQLDIQSPLYFGDRDTSFLPGVKAYRLTVPNTTHNRLLLRRPDQLDNPDDFLEEDGWQVYFDSWLLFEGRLEVEDTQKDEDFRVTFIGGLAGNLNILKETYATQLDMGTLTLGETDDDVLNHMNEVAAAPGSYSYLFPQIKTSPDPAYATEDVGPDDPPANPIATQYEFANRYYEDSYVRKLPPVFTTTWFASIPMLRLKHVIGKALALAGYSLKGVFDNDANADELNDLILFNNTTLDELEDVTDGEITFTDLKLKNTIPLNKHLPEVKLNDLIREVCNLFGWAPIINTMERVVNFKPLREIIRRPHRKDWTKKVDPRFVRGRQLEDIPQRFYLEGADGDSFYDTRPLQLVPDQVNYTFETVDAAKAVLLPADTGSTVYIESLNEYFEVTVLVRGGTGTLVHWFTSLGKDFGTINYYDEPDYVPDITTLLMLTRSYFQAGAINAGLTGADHLPSWWGSLVSPIEKGSPLKNMVLLFYRGLQTDGAGNEYPLASPLPYNYEEETIGAYSLLWTGRYGLYNVWWKEWHEALQRMRPVTYITRLSAPDISNLDLSEKVKIDKHLYFIKRIRLTITTEGIRPASIEYMQIN
jgi:hypothetical protein